MKDLQFDQQAITDLKADIFGTIVDGVQEQGLAHADDEGDFIAKLASLQQKWNALELQHRAFESREEKRPTLVSTHTHVIASCRPRDLGP